METILPAVSLILGIFLAFVVSIFMAHLFVDAGLWPLAFLPHALAAFSSFIIVRGLFLPSDLAIVPGLLAAFSYAVWAARDVRAQRHTRALKAQEK